MNSGLILQVLSGFFLFFSIRQIGLGVLTKQKKVNITIGFLALMWVFYQYYMLKMMNSLSLSEYLFNFKCLLIVLGISEILQILFVMYYAGIYSKLLFVFVIIFSILSFTLKLLLPHSILFNKVTCFYIGNNLFSESSGFVKGGVSLFSVISSLNNLVVFIYIFLVLSKLYKEKKERKTLGLIIIFGIQTLSIFNDFFVTTLKSVVNLTDLSNVALIIVINTFISYDLKKSESIKKTIREENELGIFKDRIMHYIAEDLAIPVKNLGCTELNGSKKEIILEAKANSTILYSCVINILEIYKSVESGVNLNRAVHNLTNIINRSRSTYDSLFEQRNIIFELNYASDYNVNVDENLIRKVFDNILVYALSNGKTNGRIILTVGELNGTTLGVSVFFDKKEVSTSEKDRFSVRESDRFPDDLPSSFVLLFCKSVIKAHNEKIRFDFDGALLTSIWFTLQYAIEDQYETRSMEQEEQDTWNKQIQFTEAERDYLYEYYTKLSEVQFFEITKLRKLIVKLEQDEKINKIWLSQLNQSIVEMNEAKYKNLLNLIGPSKHHED